MPQVAGPILHSDLVLSDAEKPLYVMPCDLRAAGPDQTLEF